MASAQVVETSVNTNNSPSQDYTTNPDDHSNHNICLGLKLWFLSLLQDTNFNSPFILFNEFLMNLV